MKLSIFYKIYIKLSLLGFGVLPTSGILELGWRDMDQSPVLFAVVGDTPSDLQRDVANYDNPKASKGWSMG